MRRILSVFPALFLAVGSGGATIGNYAFYQCKCLTEITPPDLSIFPKERPFSGRSFAIS